MTLAQLIVAAGGTLDSAYTIEAELTRIGIRDDSSAFLNHIRVSKDVLTDPNASDFILFPYDSLSVKPIPLWREGEKCKYQRRGCSFKAFTQLKIKRHCLKCLHERAA